VLGDFGLGNSPEIEILINAVDKTQGAFGSATSGIGLLTAAAAGATAIIVGTGAAIVQVTQKTLAWGQSLNDTKLKLGDTTAQAAGLKLAADAVNISIDQVTGAMLRLDKGLETANGKEGASAKILDDLGIKWKNANGTMMDSTALLQSVADWFAKTTDVTARNNMELSIFGRSGADVDRMLMNLSGGGMQTYIDQAKKFGLVMTDEQLNKIQAVSEQMNILQDAFKGAEVTLGEAFIPVLQNLVTWFGNFLAAEMPAITQFGQFLSMLTGAPLGAANKTIGGVGQSAAPAVSGPAPVYTGGNSASDQAWRDYWNKKGPKPGSAGAYAPGGEYAGMQSANTRYNYAAEYGGMQAANNPGGLPSGSITGFEQAILDIVTAVKTVDWGSVAAGLKTAIGFVSTVLAAANLLGGGSKDDHLKPPAAANSHLSPGDADSWSVILGGLLMNNTKGNQIIADELAREWREDIVGGFLKDINTYGKKGDVVNLDPWFQKNLIGPIVTWLTTPIIIIDPKAAATWFDNALVNPLVNAVTLSAKTLQNDMAKASVGVDNALYNFGNDLLRSVDVFLSLLGIGPVGGKWPGPDKKAGGGSFAGWAMVGDAPGGGVTPFTEYVYAPHGATVYNQAQMGGRGAPAMAGGGVIPGDGTPGGGIHYNYGPVTYVIGTAQPNDWLQATRQ
jgi:hypothetical protein